MVALRERSPYNLLQTVIPTAEWRDPVFPGGLHLCTSRRHVGKRDGLTFLIPLCCLKQDGDLSHVIFV
jgi:hypothetical protein